MHKVNKQNSPLVLDISVEFEAWSQRFPDIEGVILNVLDNAYCKVILEKVSREISVVLTNDESIQKLNQQYRGKDKPTNVLSFPIVQDNIPEVKDQVRTLGDIVLSYEMILREAEVQNKSFQNHMTHLLIHGFLHLLGYDHDTEEDADHMENIEIKILKDFGINNPYESGMEITHA